jgi:hypothetical protein
MTKVKKENQGVSLDDAFADDEDVVYSESKPKKSSKQEKPQLTQEVKHTIKSSKPIEQIKKGDKIKVDGKEYEVDAHYSLMDHKVTKEMAIEIFDAKEDRDFQIRYFTGRLDVSDPELYELQNEFMYVKIFYQKLEW